MTQMCRNVRVESGIGLRKLNPNKRAGMTNPVCYEAGGNEVTKLTRQFRNGLSESNRNLYPIGRDQSYKR